MVLAFAVHQDIFGPFRGQNVRVEFLIQTKNLGKDRTGEYK
jgi:hypothetical protein